MDGPPRGTQTSGASRLRSLSPTTSGRRAAVAMAAEPSPGASKAAVALQGGAAAGAAAAEAAARPSSPAGLLVMAWGCLGVAYVLFNPIKRLAPLALLPWGANADSPHFLGGLGWGAYVAFAAFMAYAEGYKGFQTKFCPLVVARSCGLASAGRGPGAVGALAWALKVVLAPFYAMGLFHANSKRLAVSWGMVFGISAVVAVCKRVPAPWRSVVDGGVVVGLSWGVASILCLLARTVATGAAPAVDPQLPVKLASA